MCYQGWTGTYCNQTTRPDNFAVEIEGADLVKADDSVDPVDVVDAVQAVKGKETAEVDKITETLQAVDSVKTISSS